MNRIWNSLSEADRVFIPILAANVAVFLAWRVPALAPFMTRYFTANPASRSIFHQLSLFSGQRLKSLYNIFQMSRIRHHQVRLRADGPLGFQSLQFPPLGLQHVRAARIHATRHRHTWEGTVRRLLSLFCSRVLVRQSPSQGNEFMPEE